VRNSGVHAVIEGTGDHGCEYMTSGRVVVLGPTGRNFAAGMSGGIAYVWDPDKVFHKLINSEMVDMDALTEKADIAELTNMITRHRDYTGSARAEFILNNWEKQKANFIKVIPGDYKLALQRIEEEKLMEVEEDALPGVNTESWVK
jgi:glutamate synthase domain-containing protein 3